MKTIGILGLFIGLCIIALAGQAAAVEVAPTLVPGNPTCCVMRATATRASGSSRRCLRARIRCPHGKDGND